MFFDWARFLFSKSVQMVQIFESASVNGNFSGKSPGFSLERD